MSELATQDPSVTLNFFRRRRWIGWALPMSFNEKVCVSCWDETQTHTERVFLPLGAKDKKFANVHERERESENQPSLRNCEPVCVRVFELVWEEMPQIYATNQKGGGGQSQANRKKTTREKLTPFTLALSKNPNRQKRETKNPTKKERKSYEERERVWNWIGL